MTLNNIFLHETVAVTLRFISTLENGVDKVRCVFVSLLNSPCNE